MMKSPKCNQNFHYKNRNLLTFHLNYKLKSVDLQSIIYSIIAVFPVQKQKNWKVIELFNKKIML